MKWQIVSFEDNRKYAIFAKAIQWFAKKEDGNTINHTGILIGEDNFYELTYTRKFKRYSFKRKIKSFNGYIYLKEIGEGSLIPENRLQIYKKYKYSIINAMASQELSTIFKRKKSIWHNMFYYIVDKCFDLIAALDETFFSIFLNKKLSFCSKTVIKVITDSMHNPQILRLDEKPQKYFDYLLAYNLIGEITPGNIFASLGYDTKINACK